MKIRLYRGPFDGKVFDHPRGGDNVITIIGPKPMTRKQRYEWEREQYQSQNFVFGMPARVPEVRENYEICIRTVNNTRGGYSEIVLTHPDGSIFYEWTKPKR